MAENPNGRSLKEIDICLQQERLGVDHNSLLLCCVASIPKVTSLSKMPTLVLCLPVGRRKREEGSRIPTIRQVLRSTFIYIQLTRLGHMVMPSNKGDWEI